MVLRRLSVFPAWFDMRDAIQIGARLGMSVPAVAEAVANLVTKSIATADVTDEGARYRLPETVRAYSREKLAEAEEINSTFRALARYVTEQYTNASIRQDDARLSWLACCIRNLDNTRACLDWALIDGRDPTAGIELISKALPFWMLGSRLIEHRLVSQARPPTRLQKNGLVASETSLRSKSASRLPNTFTADQQKKSWPV